MTPRVERLLLFASFVLIFLFAAFSYRHYFVIFGDSMLNMSAGRDFPIPIWGQWVAARATPEFFSHVLFKSYALIVDPVLGIEHIVDIYSSFLAAIFALNFLLLSLACIKYARLFVDVSYNYFPVVALAFFALYFPSAGQPNFTLIFAYDIPVLLAVWTALPFVSFAARGSDPLGKVGLPTSVALISALGYFTAFSITNAAFITCCLVLSSGVVSLSCSETSKGETLLNQLRSKPVWFKYGLIYIPATSLIAVIFDLNSGRFRAESAQHWGDKAAESFSFFDGLPFLKIELPGVLLFFLCSAFLLLFWNIWTSSEARKASKNRLLLSLVAILVSLVAYYLFIFMLTLYGSRVYFSHTGFTSVFHFFFASLSIAALYSFISRPGFGFLFAPVGIVIALGGLKLLSIPVQKGALLDVSVVEMRSVFNSMYMSYCYRSEKVPVFLRNARYPYVPIPAKHETNWFGISFGKVFSQFVIKDLNVRYFPSYYSVNNAEELVKELAANANSGEKRCIEMEKSPYFVDLGSAFQAVSLTQQNAEP